MQEKERRDEHRRQRPQRQKPLPVLRTPVRIRSEQQPHSAYGQQHGAVPYRRVGLNVQMAGRDIGGGAVIPQRNGKRLLFLRGELMEHPLFRGLGQRPAGPPETTRGPLRPGT